MKTLTSIQNKNVKNWVQLQEKSRERRKTGRFLIEGLREISLAVKGNYELETLLVYEELCPKNKFEHIKKKALDSIAISKEVYEKLAYRNTTEGILAIAKSKPHRLDHITIASENPLILVAEAPEKPGNIGALLRTADAAKLDAVIIANPKTDLYNPNTIRASMGCLFTVPIAIGTTEAIITFLKSKNIHIYCAALQAANPYHKEDYRQSAAIVVGTEATGLCAEWLVASDQNIVIPMQGHIDSMNVSVAAGILIFEAKRQREFK